MLTKLLIQQFISGNLTPASCDLSCVGNTEAIPDSFPDVLEQWYDLCYLWDQVRSHSGERTDVEHQMRQCLESCTQWDSLNRIWMQLFLPTHQSKPEYADRLKPTVNMQMNKILSTTLSTIDDWSILLEMQTTMEYRSRFQKWPRDGQVQIEERLQEIYVQSVDALTSIAALPDWLERCIRKNQIPPFLDRKYLVNKLDRLTQ